MQTQVLRGPRSQDESHPRPISERSPGSCAVQIRRRRVVTTQGQGPRRPRAYEARPYPDRKPRSPAMPILVAVRNDFADLATSSINCSHASPWCRERLSEVFRLPGTSPALMSMYGHRRWPRGASRSGSAQGSAFHRRVTALDPSVSPVRCASPEAAKYVRGLVS